MSKIKTRSSSFCDFDDPQTVKTDQISVWRNTQARLSGVDNPYTGNKKALVTDIANALANNNINFNSILDLFSGSSVVSLFFKLLGKSVISNDLLTSSFFHSKVFVENNGIKIDHDTLKRLCLHQNKNAVDFVQQHYGKRFTAREAKFLDNYIENAKELKSQPYMFELAVIAIEHYILKNCFLGGRLNSGQVLADLEHRINHDRNDGHEMEFALSPPASFFTHSNCLALNKDAFDALEVIKQQPEPPEMLYLDPPYGNEQSDYAEMFRFCEEYIYQQRLEDLPHILNSDKFTKNKKYKQYFTELLDRSGFIDQWAISYNDSSWADLDTIVGIVSQFKKNVVAHEIDHERKYSKDRKSVEYLIIGR